APASGWSPGTNSSGPRRPRNPKTRTSTCSERSRGQTSASTVRTSPTAAKRRASKAGAIHTTCGLTRAHRPRTNIKAARPAAAARPTASPHQIASASVKRADGRLRDVAEATQSLADDFFAVGREGAAVGGSRRLAREERRALHRRRDVIAAQLEEGRRPLHDVGACDLAPPPAARPRQA